MSRTAFNPATAFGLAVAWLAFSVATASADLAAANACAAKLSPDPKLVYDTVAPAVKPDSVIRDVVKDKLRPMVVAGKFTRDSAKAAAETAGDCLKLLR